VSLEKLVKGVPVAWEEQLRALGMSAQHSSLP